MAITAVVLGGTSICGGRGTVLGTVLGLFVIVVLQDGLRLSGFPSELTGIATGGLLVATISIDHFREHIGKQVAAVGHREFRMKNSQVVVLSVVILVSAIIVPS